MKMYENQTFPQERALYAARGAVLRHCAFDGAEDGESALKEAADVTLDDCYMNLRYPLWHVRGARLTGCTMTELCRAALWYARDIHIENCEMGGIKALRECESVTLQNTRVVSPEFGWRSRHIQLTDCRVQGEYPFFMASDLQADRLRLQGKYSFQYVQNALLEDAVLDTKDAFWHARNVTLRRCEIKGEYFAWYADGLTLDRCRIIGTQPLCYCKNLTLIDCEMEQADLAFEYSDVQATVKGSIDSVKNPLSGSITADAIGQILLTPDSLHPCRCRIATRD